MQMDDCIHSRVGNCWASTEVVKGIEAIDIKIVKILFDLKPTPQDG